MIAGRLHVVLVCGGMVWRSVWEYRWSHGGRVRARCVGANPGAAGLVWSGAWSGLVSIGFPAPWYGVGLGHSLGPGT